MACNERNKTMQYILRLPIVKSRTGLSRSSIYSQISKGDFPKQISLGQRSVGWLEEDIEDWINQRIEESQKENNDES